MDDYIDCSLHQLIINNDYEQLQSRLEDPNQRNNMGYTLLHLAALITVDNPRVVELLLQRGADVNATTTDGDTPLHLAVSSQKQYAVRALIEAGASVNLKGKLRKTALHLSVSMLDSSLLRHDVVSDILESDMRIVKRLLCHPEIFLDPVDHVGDTPLMLAVKGRHSYAVEVFLNKGANPNISDKYQRTPLHEALSAHEPVHSIVSTLLLNGAGIYCVDNSQQTPIDILLRKVRYKVNSLFAMQCVWIIALRYQIRESLKRKLKSNRKLYDHLDDCCKEVGVMRKLIIYENFTLHDFALGCLQTRVADPLREIYVPLVESLVFGSFKIYFKFLFSRLSYSNVRGVLEITTGKPFYPNLVSHDAFKLRLYETITRFYDKNVELKRRLLRFK